MSAPFAYQKAASLISLRSQELSEGRQVAGRDAGGWLRPRAPFGVRGAAVPEGTWAAEVCGCVVGRERAAAASCPGVASRKVLPWGWVTGWCYLPPYCKGVAHRGFLAKLPKSSNIPGCSFLTLLLGWRSCPWVTPGWPVPVALEGCTELADCSDKAYPVIQAVCHRTAFAQRSPCRSQFGHAQPAGLNVPLLLSPAWRKSATWVTVYSYTCTCLSFLNSILIKYKNSPGDGGDGMPGHPWLSLQVQLQCPYWEPVLARFLRLFVSRRLILGT